MALLHDFLLFSVGKLLFISFVKLICRRKGKNGVPAPFLEYALVSSWMDKSMVHRFKIWEDDGKMVGLVFYENTINDVYFSLKPGYEKLADEMVEYADTSMPRVNGYLKLVIFEGQIAIEKAARKIGYVMKDGYWDNVFDFKKSLNYQFP